MLISILSMPSSMLSTMSPTNTVKAGEDLTNGILNHLFHDKDEITAWEMNDYLTTEFDSETLQEAMNYLSLGFGY